MSQIVLRLQSAVDRGLPTIDYSIDNQLGSLSSKFLNHKLLWKLAESWGYFSKF
jgi:hypothetical protein